VDQGENVNNYKEGTTENGNSKPEKEHRPLPKLPGKKRKKRRRAVAIRDPRAKKGGVSTQRLQHQKGVARRGKKGENTGLLHQLWRLGRKEIERGGSAMEPGKDKKNLFLSANRAEKATNDGGGGKGQGFGTLPLTTLPRKRDLVQEHQGFWEKEERRKTKKKPPKRMKKI